MGWTWGATHVRARWVARESLEYIASVRSELGRFSLLVNARSIGSLSCTADCVFDTSRCHPLAVSTNVNLASSYSTSCINSLLPRPRPAFRRFCTASDGKLGGAWERG